MVPPVGPRDARIMLVGEAPGEREVVLREPFVGPSGMLLNEMLHDAGITRAECFITNLARERPPHNEITEWIAKSQRAVTAAHVHLKNKLVLPPIARGYELLQKEVSLVQPNVIVAFGNVSMWALTGKWGIKSWRGSLLSTDPSFSSESRKVLPAYHPAYILRDFSQRYITVHDLRRANAQKNSPELTRPSYSFITRPSYLQVYSFLKEIYANLQTREVTISCDLETRGGQIACVGLALSKLEAICIPFMCVERGEGYFDEREEVEVVRLLRLVLCHANARVIGQNFIYDSQYLFRQWGFVPNFSRDTMLGHHCCFSGLPKGLDYLSSLYCEYHVYWKDEGKKWETKMPENQLWEYNCKDAVITYEADDAIQETTRQYHLETQSEFQQAMFWPVLQAMVRGVRVDTKRKNELARELREAAAYRAAWLEKILDHKINPGSPQQLKVLFYDDLKQAPIFKRSTGQVTLDDDALQKIGAREILLRPLVRAIAEYRSLSVLHSTIGEARLDKDQRLRCSYNIAGTETFRFASSENAFGNGLNLQTLTKGLTKGAQKGSYAEGFRIPNTRKLLIPDIGYTFFAGDLERADFYVVVWEADDNELKAVLREGGDIHAENAKLLFSVRVPTSIQRELSKRWVHGTDYGGKARTMAAACGITVHEAEKLRVRWFEAHPGIQRWHDRTTHQLRSRRMVENRFGYRRYYFDRPDSVFNEALAWVPQSTVALYINHIWMELYLNHPEIQVLLQVHDELAGQFPSDEAARWRDVLLDTARDIVVPYEDPLTIPFKIKTSTVSWGDCE